MTTGGKNIDQLAINNIRTLAIDAIEKANSGHPGMPMGSAPMAYELWSKFMKHNPSNPEWVNRDRFVLSAGHGSALLYSLLHLFGYDVTIEDLKGFRQWGSRTPGHPEFGHTAGVDATTGPLGQGLAMAVGMAMAEEHVAAVYNRDGYNVIDHHTYVICGDGDFMEGISSEAASLAGHQQLNKLIVLYDSNDISLDGELNLSFSENVQQRFKGYGWDTLFVEDGNDLDAIHQAIAKAKTHDRPTLIEVKTVIGFGSPNKAGKGGSEGTHGSPLGAEEVKLTKEAYGWPADSEFLVKDQVAEHFAALKANGEQENKAWNELFEKYKQAHPELAVQFEQAFSGELPDGWDAALPAYGADDKAISTRVASGNAINGIAQNYPMLFGGSADLEVSTMTHMNGAGQFIPTSYEGRNVYFGVREFAMGAAANGMMLHGGVHAYAGTFFVFSDYLRPAIRLSALMKLPVTYVFTHDSIGVGEDGPTHQPIEQLPALRVMIGLNVIRPADANETSAAWKFAVENKEGPTALVLTRQNLPILEGTADKANEGVRRGAYVISEAAQSPSAIIIATGSEVALAVEAQQKLAEEQIHVRVVSMPSWELFDQQDQQYKDSVLLPEVKTRLAIEMAYPQGWEKYVGDAGKTIGIETYGASAKGPKVIEEYGFNVANVVETLKSIL